jgi:DNA-binding FadR family transcriptional regulator
MRADRPQFLKIADNRPRSPEELVNFDSELVVDVLGGGAGTTRDTFELLHQTERSGTKLAFFGRKINLTEAALHLVALMRQVVDGAVSSEEAVRADHGALQELGVRPVCSLGDDRVITEEALMSAASRKTLQVNHAVTPATRPSSSRGLATASHDFSDGRGDRCFERSACAHGLAAKLGRDILSGVYPAGSLLPQQAEMCRRLLVSRTALREALSFLAAKGLIVARPKIGTRVRPTSEWNLLDPEILSWRLQLSPADSVGDLLALRQLIEPETAALAACCRTGDAMERIGQACDLGDQLGNEEYLTVADLDFHTAVASATNNNLMIALGRLIHAALEMAVRACGTEMTHFRDTHARHQHLVFEAIRDGAPALARQRMAALLLDQSEDIRRLLRP